MKFDRNTILGFGLLAVLFFGYFYFNNKQQAEAAREQARLDSIKLASQPKIPVQDSLKRAADSLRNVQLNDSVAVGNFPAAKEHAEQLVYASNGKMVVAFTTHGGQPKWIRLNDYKNQDSGIVQLSGYPTDKLSYPVKTGKNGVTETANLDFSRIDSTTNADGSRTYSFTTQSSDSSAAGAITHSYTIRKDDYLIDLSVNLSNASQLVDQGTLNLTWDYTAMQQESDFSYEKTNTQMGYVMDGDFDYYTAMRRSDKEFSDKVKWVGMRQRFFFAALVAKEQFAAGGSMNWTLPDDSNIIVHSTAKLKAPLTTDGKAGFSMYFGPADYQQLKKYDLKFEKLINLGQGMYAFVRPLNKYVIMPIFNLFKGLGNYGLAILLLTLIIRLIISPLTYTSYLSGAKMKALRPEIAALKAKYGGDQQAMSMEQMKLFREAGVNPLGGCIPALLQIPIFFALFSFFGSEISLRGADFLWSSDLAAPDKVIHFSHIPLVGDHISIFTITAVITSLLISLYSMSMTPDQGNPIMKYLPYVFPIFMFFIFNNLPSALTWYYTVSNLITLGMQFVIQNYIIDHKKVLAKIEENRKKPKTKSKWQQRMEEMQEQQKRMREQQQRNKR